MSRTLENFLGALRIEQFYNVLSTREKLIKSKQIALLALSILVASCENTAPVPAPDVKLKNKPEIKYEIMIDAGALPVQRVTGSAYFNIINSRECVKPDYSLALGGIHNSYTRHAELVFYRDGASHFKGTLIRDPFHDADYYGRGICHWDITGITLRLTGDMPTQDMTIRRDDLSNNYEYRVSSEYCAAEDKYALPIPIVACRTNLSHVTQEISGHLFEVKKYTRRLGP